ncbi:hypothetical protein K488DRAFT_74664, partial [Vararia minispora EC-137]
RPPPSRRSLEQDIRPPRPLPTPPPDHRPRIRADTLPSPGPGSQDPQDPHALGAEDLPANPKTWAPAQLSAYLLTALRTRTLTPDADADAPAIAAWIRAHGITGRAFLRWTDADLRSRGVGTLRRTALLAAARSLRQNVLRGRIWGSTPDSAPSFYAAQDDDASDTSASESELDLSDASAAAAAAGARLRRRNAGRVRGLVSRWERAGSESESGSPTRSESLHGSPTRSESLHGSPTRSESWRGSPTRSESLRGSPTRENGTLNPNAAAVEPTIEELLAGVPASGSWGARAWEAADGGTTVKRADETDVDGCVSGSARRIGSGSGSGRRIGKGSARRIVTALFVGEPGPGAEERDAAASGPAVTSGGAAGLGFASGGAAGLGFAPGDAAELGFASGDAAGLGFAPGDAAELGFASGDAVEARLCAVEAALAAELADGRARLAAFRARIEDVEMRVGEMEARRREAEAEDEGDGRRREAEVAEARRREVEEAHRREVEEAVRRAVSEARDAWEAEAQAMRADAARGKAVARRDAVAKALLEPHRFRELPGYLALVGFGLCAVVLKVVLRRIAAGRRA